MAVLSGAFSWRPSYFISFWENSDEYVPSPSDAKF
jgi:hypothetical protein